MHDGPHVTDSTAQHFQKLGKRKWQWQAFVAVSCFRSFVLCTTSRNISVSSLLYANLVFFQSAPAVVSFVSPQRREQSELY